MVVKHGDVAKTRFLFDGRFDFKKFYDFLFSVVAANGYTVMEEAFAQKTKDLGEDVEIEWKFEKEVDDYTQFVISIGFYVSEMNELIVKRDGGEVKTNEGKVKVVISGQIITDYQGNWERNKFLEVLRDFYERYLFKGTYDDYEIEVYGDIFLFENEVKSFFMQPRF